jgi:hypothetical protein
VQKENLKSSFDNLATTPPLSVCDANGTLLLSLCVRKAKKQEHYCNGKKKNMKKKKESLFFSFIKEF